jgi:hypothetical protein
MLPATYVFVLTMFKLLGHNMYGFPKAVSTMLQTLVSKMEDDKDAEAITKQVNSWPK